MSCITELFSEVDDTSGFSDDRAKNFSFVLSVADLNRDPLSERGASLIFLSSCLDAIQSN